MIDLDELIAEAREFADRNNGLNWQGTVRDLADALEAVTRERDAATEARIERWMQLVGKGVEERMAAEAERDAALAAIERVRAIHRPHTYGNGCTVCHWCDTTLAADDSWPCPTVAALDGAPEPEWEYGLLVEALGDTEPEPYPTRESAQHVIDHPEMYRKWTHDNPVTMYSRRPAGPWLPVGGEKP